MEFLCFYLFIINIISFFMFGIDKAKAKFNKWRIPEITLLGASLIGGSVGAIFGMGVFRHKTKHMKFKVLNPLFFILHILIIVLLIFVLHG